MGQVICEGEEYSIERVLKETMDDFGHSRFVWSAEVVFLIFLSFERACSRGSKTCL